MAEPSTRTLRVIEEKGDDTVTEDFDVFLLVIRFTSIGVCGFSQSLRCVGMYG